MNRYLIFGFTVSCILIAFVLIKIISGGSSTEVQVADVVKTNAFIIAYLHETNLDVKESQGPWRVNLRPNGSRYGYYSFLIAGAKTNGDFRIEWVQNPKGIEITGIFKQAYFQQDKLIWRKREN